MPDLFYSEYPYSSKINLTNGAFRLIPNPTFIDDCDSIAYAGIRRVDEKTNVYMKKINKYTFSAIPLCQSTDEFAHDCKINLSLSVPHLRHLNNYISKRGHDLRFQKIDVDSHKLSLSSDATEFVRRWIVHPFTDLIFSNDFE